MSGQLAVEVKRCVSNLCAAVQSAGPSESEVVVHGSAVLDDFIPGRSDLDVPVIVNEAASTPEIDAVVDAFQTSDASPATGFEVSVVSDVSALNPGEPWQRRTTGNPDLDTAEVQDWVTAVALTLSSRDSS